MTCAMKVIEYAVSTPTFHRQLSIPSTSANFICLFLLLTLGIISTYNPPPPFAVREVKLANVVTIATALSLST